MAKEDRKPLKENFRERPLKGTSLLFRINALTGSSNLEKFNGSIKELAIECGYVSNKFRNMPVSETVRKNIKKFVYEYHKANKTNSPKEKLTIIDDAKLDRLLSYSKPKSASQKKFEKLLKKELDKPRTRNSPQRRTLKVNSNFEEEIKNAKLNENDLKKAINKSEVEEIKKQKKLRKLDLIEHAEFFHRMGATEQTICETAGYKSHNINTFRNDFAKFALVEPAPLKIMIRNMLGDPVWEKHFSNIDEDESKEESKKQENQEFVDSLDPYKEQIEEFVESEELFINREKITSQVNRTYRNPKFRKKVLAKYGSVCACCDIAIETLLEAAHIIPVENNGNDDAGNGIPLCPTHHTAFDNFLFTINPSDKSIIYKEGLGAEDIQITKTKCDINVSKESLDYRFKLFNE